VPQEGNTKHARVVRISYTLSRDTTQKSVAQFIAVCRRSKVVDMDTEGIKEARVFAGDGLCNGEKRRHASARFYALQSAIN
jgi:hypothetical protein